MIRITCTSCQKPLSLDETKLPMKEVAFPCPVCKVKLTVDRRVLAGGAAPAPSEPTAPLIESSETHGPDDDHENDFGSKAMIVGNDSPAIRQAVKLIGFLPVLHADPVRAREFYMQEYPQVVLLNPAQLTPPPLESMAPIISLMPADRRRSFFVLTAENLRTLDGNAAFLYGVNVVVATKDLGQFSQIYKEAYTSHERLYSSLTSVLREKQAL